MFLHSGAGLHGHEFSKRSTRVVAHPHTHSRRNGPLRVSYPPHISRASTFPLETLLLRDHEVVSNLKRPQSLLESAGPCQDNLPVNTREAKNLSPPLQVEAMSEDETSIISDAETSHISSSARTRLSSSRKGTKYALAHPPPKLRTKQRIIRIHPNLVLQIQELSPGQRSKPVIDVYPSSAIARSIIALLLKRFPRISRIKRDLAVNDIMLIRSEDYTSPSSDSEGDDE